MALRQLEMGYQEVGPISNQPQAPGQQIPISRTAPVIALIWALGHEKMLEKPLLFFSSLGQVHESPPWRLTAFPHRQPE